MAASPDELESKRIQVRNYTYFLCTLSLNNRSLFFAVCRDTEQCHRSDAQLRFNGRPIRSGTFRPVPSNSFFINEFHQMLAQVPVKTVTATKRKAKDLEEDGEGKVKRKRQPRKARDPNEPRRPASAYILFQNDVRKELKSQHPTVSQSELLNMISKQWNEMTDDQKSVSASQGSNACISL
jgi:hypothetical protein